VLPAPCLALLDIGTKGISGVKKKRFLEKAYFTILLVTKMNGIMLAS
jgi:hypothetical protein